MRHGGRKSARSFSAAHETPRGHELVADAGIEAAHWADLGAGNAPDAEIMAFAMAHGYVVLTQDLDFSAILAATHGAKPSVVQIRSVDISPEAVGRAVVSAVRQLADGLDGGALLSVEPNRMRLRLLPLQPS